MTRKQNNLEAKYGNEENITEKQNGYVTEKQLKGFEERKYTLIHSEQHSKEYQIGKR